jgi:hypothetical protein
MENPAAGLSRLLRSLADLTAAVKVARHIRSILPAGCTMPRDGAIIFCDLLASSTRWTNDDPWKDYG